VPKLSQNGKDTVRTWVLLATGVSMSWYSDRSLVDPSHEVLDSLLNAFKNHRNQLQV
jgi:hypothetical protein